MKPFWNTLVDDVSWRVSDRGKSPMYERGEWRQELLDQESGADANHDGQRIADQEPLILYGEAGRINLITVSRLWLPFSHDLHK